MPFQSFASPLPHFVLELAAYAVGARVYWARARVSPAAQWDASTRWMILAAAIFGAMLGSKLLHVLEHLPALRALDSLPQWLGGKSVLGGFLGGTLGVEIAKRACGVRGATGDAWVPALTVGLVIGRLGCQFSGTWDHTYGTPTALPWGWNYGDNVPRHPTGFYEIAWVLVAFAIASARRLRAHAGASFALFLLLYCAGRFGLEFVKPPYGAAAADTLPVARYAGLTAIQWAACVGAAWYGLLLRKRLQA
jgi:phosphatidylglycerol---prolipoprotein diacylglyceryl transferase